MNRPIQVSLRNVFWAMAWAAVWGCVLVMARQMWHLGPHGSARVAAYFGLGPVLAILPFTVVGALFCRAKSGTIVGAKLLVLLYLLSSLISPLLLLL